MSIMHRIPIPARLALMVFTMLGLSFAAVPFYDWFCRVTGFGGVTQKAVAPSDRLIDRDISIRFDASLASDMRWEFKPEQHSMTLRIGENGLAFYEAYNPTDEVITGTASFNVYPYAAGYYFNKIDCFCFEQQVLQPGERVQMPVSFFVDPEMLNDKEAAYIHTITLSYTFHVTDSPTEHASLATPNQSQVKKH